MAALDRRTLNDLIKLVIFIVITTLATSVLVATIGNLSFSGKREFRAEFVDATGVVKGDDVRVAGVKVGSVEDIEIVDRTHARVTFTVEEGTDLDESTFAAIRYRNLVGQRYISLSQQTTDGSDDGEVETLDEGDTIPVERTSPALDLTVLFNGFKPLFQALSPDDVNKLSYEVVQVFQGEGGTLENLLGHTASITQTLADRDQVIGDLIDNLDFVLDHVADRDEQLSDLIVSFRDLVGGLKDDREAILASLDGISALSVQTAELVKGIRPSFVEDVKQLRRFAGNVDRNKAELDRALQVLPIKLEKIGRTAIYGSFFNFYLCEFSAKVVLPGNVATVNIPKYSSGADRCDLG
jgi:phospholipid/cholesterol/gamma-HCH transport system substrate-binding protein